MSASTGHASTNAERTNSPTATDQSIEHLDFAPICRTQQNTRGHTCGQTAVAYLEVHRVGYCHDPVCNEHGNMCGNVCQHHLDMFMEMAQGIIDDAPEFRMGFPISHTVCGSCGMPIRSVSDIIQRIVAL